MTRFDIWPALHVAIANVSALLRCARPVVLQWPLKSNAYEMNLVCKGLPYCDIGSEAALEFLGTRRRRLVAERAKQFGCRGLVEDADDRGMEASEDRIWQARRS